MEGELIHFITIVLSMHNWTLQSRGKYCGVSVFSNAFIADHVMRDRMRDPHSSFRGTVFFFLYKYKRLQFEPFSEQMIVNDPFLGVIVCQSSTLIQQQKNTDS